MGGSVWRGEGGDQIYPFPYYYYARMVESMGDPSTSMTGDMHCHTMPVNHKVGTCGGVPSKGIPDCDRPVKGKAPDAKTQECLDRIADKAVELATQHCANAYASMNE